MGDRKQPTPVPTNQIKPDPPPAPPRPVYAKHIPPKRYTSGGPPRCFTRGQVEWKCRCDPPRWKVALDEAFRPITDKLPPRDPDVSSVRRCDLDVALLCGLIACVLSFLLGVGFAEWTR